MSWAACRTSWTSSKTRSPANAGRATTRALPPISSCTTTAAPNCRADETNGNTPLVSAHEVAWYAWTATKDPRMAELIAAGEVKNMVDLCYQTLALADMDPQKYREQIRTNAERILSLQRPDGQWAMRFDAGQPEAEFQTGHALWALHAAGVPVSNPQVAKAIDYLLRRQQVFGGWMDPLQSYENFRTPFRETQMAILALSSYFPLGKRAKGWGSPPVRQLSGDPVEMLRQLDDMWDPPSASIRREVEAAAQSPDPLIRQAAVETLGRLGIPEGSTRDCWATPASSCSAQPHGPCGRSTAATPAPRPPISWLPSPPPTIAFAGAPRGSLRSISRSWPGARSSPAR